MYITRIIVEQGRVPRTVNVKGGRRTKSKSTHETRTAIVTFVTGLTLFNEKFFLFAVSRSARFTGRPRPGEHYT